MSIAFISGHLDLTEEEFDEHYRDIIWNDYVSGVDFIVGDADGCDYIAQRLLQFLVSSKTTVYHMLDFPRNNVKNFPTVGGFKSDKERDEAMTAASDYDIAWIRPGREKSGTAKNILRRKKSASQK